MTSVMTFLTDIPGPQRLNMTIEYETRQKLYIKLHLRF